MSLNESMRPFIWAFLATTLLGVAPTSAQAAEPTLDLEWGISPTEAEAAVDEDLDGGGWRKFERRERRVELEDKAWTHFLVFYDDELISQGYERDESPESPRVGTLSDIVSYDNDYWMAAALRSRHGEPEFEDLRSKSDYSQELGDPAERARRSVDWDLEGERIRWETDAGPIRYTVKFSLKGVRNHRVVKVDPSAAKHYHFYHNARAFRRAGIDVVRRFERKSQKMVVAMVTPSGESAKTEVETEGDKLVPVQPEKTQRRLDNCKIDDHDCDVTVSMYGGRLYQIEVDLSESGRAKRTERGAFDKAGERVYRRFLKVNEQLGDKLGEPAADTSVTDLEDDRTLRRVRRLAQGMEAFWTVWYDPSRDVLVRHVITGEQSGSEWRIEHRVVFRLHSVTRALADEEAFQREAESIERRKDEETDGDGGQRESDTQN